MSTLSTAPRLSPQPGQTAYEAYCQAVQGRSLISGAVLPTFEDLSDPVKEAWTAAETVVRRQTLDANLLGFQAMLDGSEGDVDYIQWRLNEWKQTAALLRGRSL